MRIAVGHGIWSPMDWNQENLTNSHVCTSMYARNGRWGVDVFRFEWEPPNGRKLGINHTHTWKNKGESRLLSREWDHNIITVILGKQKLRPSTLIRRIFVMGKPKKKKSNFRRRRRRRSFDIKGDSDTSPDQMKAGERSCGHLIHAYPPHPQSLSRTHTHQLLPSCHYRPVWKTTSNRTTKIFSHIK